MAVVCKSDIGAVIDHLSYINRIYEQCCTQNTPKAPSSYEFIPDFFKINSQFRMDSQFQKLAAWAHVQPEKVDSDKLTTRVRKKKKRKLEDMNEGEVEAIRFHEQIKDILKKALDQLVALAQKDGFLRLDSDMSQDNNQSARAAAAQRVGPGDGLVEMCNMAKDVGLLYASQTPLGDEDDAGMLFNTLVHNSSETACVRNIADNSYLFPPNCTFLMSDISCLDLLLGSTDKNKFDLIVLDPPWYNKSVKRKHQYHMLGDHDLLQLPIKSLANDGCLVVLWATNRQQQHRFIKNELFKEWGVKPLADWYWIKVTTCGQPITELENPHKKPYETIFIGHVTSSKDDVECKTPERTTQIPKEFIVVSIPSSLHSHKPPLYDVLKGYLNDNPRCLELFARSLLPGWTSWGNEVLKLQHLDFYKRLDETVS